MKLIHLSDLHLGKRVNGFSMLDDQKYILTKIINIIDDEKPESILIAGDIYDKSVPSAEAVQLFDDFLCRLAERKLQVFVISGNHDSAERLSFASSLIDLSGIHISPVYNRNIEPFVLEDEFGKVNVYMLPFVKPAHVRAAFEIEEINDYTEAIKFVFDHLNVNTNERNIIVAHQFVTGAERCDSEELSVGGLDNVDVSVFEPFDYVALGHIHGPQKLMRDTVRYAGSPLKYSFSEANHKKSATIIEMGEKNDVTIRTVPLIPKYDLVEIKGTYETLMSKSFYEGLNSEDYYHITLTDEEDVMDAITRLRTVYPKIMKLDYDNTRTRTNAAIEANQGVDELLPIDLVNELYEKQNGQALNDSQREYAIEQIEEIWRDEV